MTSANLNGGTALVTGVTSGTGYAIARHLLEAGARVAGIGRAPAALDAAAHSWVRAIGTDPTERTLRRLRAGALTGSATSIEQVAAMTAIMARPLWQNITGEVITHDGDFAHAYLVPTPRCPEPK